MNPQIDADTLDGFLSEATGYLPAIRRGVALFRNDPTDAALLEEPHRLAHTIGGAASMVGFLELGQVARGVEGTLDELAQGHRAPADETFAGLENGLVAIEGWLSAIRQGAPMNDSLDAPSAPGFALFDTAELPAFGEAETIADFGIPIPDFDAAPEPAPAATADDVSEELLEVFRLEAGEHLRVLIGTLLAARNGAASEGEWQQVRRAAHTLKGAASMVGFAGVTTLAHRMEDLLDSYHEGRREATPDELDLLIASAEAIDDAVNGRPADFVPLLDRFNRGRAADAEAPGPAVVPTPRASAAGVRPAAVKPAGQRVAGESSVRVPLESLSEIVRLVGELVISRTAFEQRLGDFRRLLQELEPTAARLRRISSKIETGYEVNALPGGHAGGHGAADGFDALEFDRYTELHLLSRELAEATGDIQTVDDELGDLHGDFAGHLTRQARLGSEIEEKLTRLRMVPLSTVAPRLHRTVRNAAQQTGKRAELTLVGEGTGLDKAVLEAMSDPLLHLLRNAVDHGLEDAETRRAAGKPEAGVVTLTAGHEAGQVVLVVSDDGGGIDLDRVRATAVRRNLVAADVAQNLGEAESHELLFRLGFSTRDRVSELSGRGVGLDVVRTQVERLKGTVQVHSTPGVGTTFTVRLPMTLAVTRALLVRSNRQTYAIPLEAVEQIVRPEPGEVLGVGGSAVYRVGDRVYPLTPLSRLLKLRPTGDEPASRPPVVLLKARGQRLGVVVDQLLGGREVVIKDLGSHLKRAPGVSGATLLGDGSVVLILDPGEFGRQVVAAPSAPPTNPKPARPAGAGGALTVLIVDDSPSVRRVLTILAERNGWVALTAKDGLEAVETLQRGDTPPDILLSDVEMPRMDGYELLGTVRSQAALRDLPVVMISSRSGEKHRQRALHLGASAYVSKPYQDESLVALIRQLVAARRSV